MEGTTFILQPNKCWCGSDSDDTDALCLSDRYGLSLTTVACMRCGTLRFREYISESDLDRFYRFSYQSLYGRKDEARRSSDAVLTANHILSFAPRIVDKNPKQIRFLEVGGGSLHLGRELAKHMNQVCVCEPSVEYSHRELPENLEFVNLTVDELVDVHNNSYDIICLVHVLEHLDNPLDTLTKLKSLLSPGGIILFYVPDIWKALSSDQRLHANRALGYIHIAHKWNFCDYSMTIMGQRTDMRCIRACLPDRGSIKEAIYILNAPDRYEQVITGPRSITYNDTGLLKRVLRAQIRSSAFRRLLKNAFRCVTFGNKVNLRGKIRLQNAPKY